jgi:hypothetical protein
MRSEANAAAVRSRRQPGRALHPSSVPIASSPEACALAGYPPSARARVVGSHVNGDLAAVYVLAEEGADWLSIVRRDDGGWTELGGGDGGSVAGHG